MSGRWTVMPGWTYMHEIDYWCWGPIFKTQILSDIWKSISPTKDIGISLVHTLFQEHFVRTRTTQLPCLLHRQSQIDSRCMYLDVENQCWITQGRQSWSGLGRAQAPEGPAISNNNMIDKLKQKQKFQSIHGSCTKSKSNWLLRQLPITDPCSSQNDIR